MDNYNYPEGADNKSAPWNSSNPEKEIEVTVCLSISKTVKLKVSDYTIEERGKDEDGNYYENIDFSDCDLVSAAQEQVDIPKGWIVDDFEVIKD